MIDDEEMAGAEGNKHGYNRHEERTQPYKEFQWQAPPKISGFFPRGEDGKEHYESSDGETKSNE